MAKHPTRADLLLVVERQSLSWRLVRNNRGLLTANRCNSACHLSRIAITHSNLVDAAGIECRAYDFAVFAACPLTDDRWSSSLSRVILCARALLGAAAAKPANPFPNLSEARMSARKRPPYAEPLELDGDMNRTDLVFLLRRLRLQERGCSTGRG